MYYIPGSGQGTEPGKRLLMWGYYLQVPEGALSSVLVDDQERQQSSSVPFGKVHPQVKAGFESRLADLLPPLLFELVQQSSNSAIQRHLLRCALQLRPRSPVPGRRRRCGVPPVHRERRAQGGGQCHLIGGRPRRRPGR